MIRIHVRAMSALFRGAFWHVRIDLGLYLRGFCAFSTNAIAACPASDAKLGVLQPRINNLAGYLSPAVRQLVQSNSGTPLSCPFSKTFANPRQTAIFRHIP
ncbi:MAG TPA: hypothetical protein VKZ53_12915 [Candidatus Angelobacter sp.]|nr:hypothetical protein [Candidatus Angelobacter sp.]